MADALPDSDQIEADLARTRSRMDRRLDQLQAHLTPKQMLNDAFSYFRGGDGADITQDLLARVRADPMPLALVGVGVAWLIASTAGGRSGTRPAPGDALHSQLRTAEASTVRMSDEDDHAYQARHAEARGLVLNVTHGADDTTASYAERVSTAMSGAARGAQDLTHDMTRAASDTAGSFFERVAHSGTQLTQGTPIMAQSTRETLSSLAGNPFALGAIAAVVGAMAGSLLPTFEQEEAALATTAATIREKGRDLAQEVVDRGTRVATDTLDAVKDSADTHGLTADSPVGDIADELKSGDLASHVKAVAQETLLAGQDSASKQLAS